MAIKDNFSEAMNLIQTEAIQPKAQKLTAMIWMILLPIINFIAWYNVIKRHYVEAGILAALFSAYSIYEWIRAYQLWKRLNPKKEAETNEEEKVVL